jgi:hypothetical protein
MKVTTTHRVLAYIAAAVALVSVILALVSRLLLQTVGFRIESYMIVAAVALLFAVYFLLEGAVHAARK